MSCGLVEFVTEARPRVAVTGDEAGSEHSAHAFVQFRTKKGDVHGGVDSEHLGKSLHLVGYCYSSLGQFAEALPWFERAVAAKEKGDVHGRLD